MKRFIAISCIILCSSAQALSGAAQIRVEALYDDYRKQYLAPYSIEKQVELVSKTQKALAEYKKRTTISKPAKEVISYLEHLFCHTRSLFTGYYCEDNYHTASVYTTHKDKLTVTQIRNILTQEHSKRRVERGLSALTRSSVLDSIAQAYATELCEA